LQIKHHSTVDLIHRLEKSGRIVREAGMTDQREVLIRLTPSGEHTLHEFSVERALGTAVRQAKRTRRPEGT
jgi:DNA-binding MarR family transcriptional regulator